MTTIIQKADYDSLVNDIGELIKKGRKKAIQSVNITLLHTYWHIGLRIIEFEQHGNEKADYGSEVLKRLSKDLKAQYGKGFSKSNVYLMRRLYLKYEKFQTLSGKLSWSHYAELLSISDDLARSFYEKQCINDNWSVRELKRQRNSGLFERLALSKDKQGVLELARSGQVIDSGKDLIKDPYVFEFLDIPESHKYTEKELEARLIDNLESFLLELGKGFAFVGRQYRITINNTHYYVDVVFYHRILKCFILIDLKIGKVNQMDIGQMNLYLNYIKNEENVEGDTEPVGLILAADKDDIFVEYATGSISNQLFVSRYQIYLPDRQELEKQLKYLLERDDKANS